MNSSCLNITASAEKEHGTTATAITVSTSAEQHHSDQTLPKRLGFPQQLTDERIHLPSHRRWYTRSARLETNGASHTHACRRRLQRCERPDVPGTIELRKYQQETQINGGYGNLREALHREKHQESPTEHFKINTVQTSKRSEMLFLSSDAYRTGQPFLSPVRFNRIGWFYLISRSLNA